MTKRDYLLIALIALVVGIGLLLLLDEPGYADAYYYYNGGETLAAGDGFNDPYLWIYFNAPDELPAPSHTYWMPLTSILIAGSMTLFGQTFVAAQIPSLIMLVALVVMSAWLGFKLSGQRRYGWLTALGVLAGGYYLAFWLTTDAFALYGFLGAMTIIAVGLGLEKNQPQWFALAGIFGALAHLTRNDGLLLILVGLVVIWWPWTLENRAEPLNRVQASSALIMFYIALMMSWFARNIAAFGSPLPSGGIGTAFLRDYNEIFDYPVDWSFSYFWEWGIGNILNSRFESLLFAVANWVAVEGVVLLGPFALWMLWKKRREAMLTTFWVYALGLHIVMSIIFAFPGARGGLLHSSVALFPFWIALGVMGLDRGIAQMAQWRKWETKQAQAVFTTATIIMIFAIGLFFGRLQAAAIDAGTNYRSIAADYLPEDAVLMVNSPPTWYYFTDHSGVPLPNGDTLDYLPEIVEQWCVTHLILDKNVTENFKPMFIGEENPPPFLEEIAHLTQDTEEIEDDVKIYRFTVACVASE